MVRETRHFNGEHILIIDDRTSFVYSIAEALKKEGCRISVTDEKNLREMALRGDAIDLILVDERMPVTELDDLVHATRQAVIPAPVAVMLTWENVDYVSDLLEKDCVEFVDKHLGPYNFVKQVQMILHQYDKKHALKQRFG